MIFVAMGLLNVCEAQPITGVWKGKINNKRVEVKLIQKGDSITGTSYYPGLVKNYRRYSVKGYFDGNTNSIVWWDDQLLFPKERDNNNDRPFFSADYNCPGGSRMFLTSDPRNKQNSTVDLTKVNGTSYRDEWDFVIDNYQYGANDPYIIDSVRMIAFTPTPSPAIAVVQPKSVATKPEEKIQPKATPKKTEPVAFLDPKELQQKPTTNKPPESKPAETAPPKKPEPVAFVDPKDLQPKPESNKPPENKPAVAATPKKTEPLVFLDPKELQQQSKTAVNKTPEIKPEEIKPIEKVVVSKPEPVEKREIPVAKIVELKEPLKPPTNEERFKMRKKEFALEIPVSGDSIEIRFYDNAEVDGDSISLFLNDKLIFEHVRLTSFAYTIKLSVKDMNESNEMVMVAENLGSIPPNTSYMVIMVGEKKYDAQIVSTETTSALIRLRKELPVRRD